MDVFFHIGLEELTKTVLDKWGRSEKAYNYGSIFAAPFFSYLCGGEYLEEHCGIKATNPIYVIVVRNVLKKHRFRTTIAYFL